MSQKQDHLVYEDQCTHTAWFNDAIPGGSAKNNFDRIIELRKLFCHPLTINKDGTLNKKYFMNVTKETAMNWSDLELLQLYQGIYKHGVHCIENWHKIQSGFLPQRDFIEVRLKISQLLGCQDLDKYKGVSFTSEQEIQNEFEKNKREAIANGTWNETCNVALKSDIAKLTDEDEKNLAMKELNLWKKYIYDNPNWIFRTKNKRTVNRSKPKSQNKGKNQKKKTKKSSKKGQKNTVDSMFKKQAEKANVETQETKEEKEKKQNRNTKVEPMEDDTDNKEEKPENEDVDLTMSEKPNKQQKNKSNQGPLMPDDSDDEDMLCVE